jgi:hypothetical protein
VAPTIERIGSGCASNLVRVLIRLTAPFARLINAGVRLKTYKTAVSLDF